MSPTLNLGKRLLRKVLMPESLMSSGMAVFIFFMAGRNFAMSARIIGTSFNLRVPLVTSLIMSDTV